MTVVSGERRRLDSNTPILLDDPHRAWLVDSGEVDLFVVPRTAGTLGRRFFLGSVRAGALLVGAPDTEVDGVLWQLVGVGVAADVVDLGESWLVHAGDASEVQRGLHQTLTDLAVARVVAGPVLAAGDVASGTDVQLVAGQVVNSQRGLRWLTLDDATMSIGAHSTLAHVSVPIGYGAYLSVDHPGKATIHDSADVPLESRQAGVAAMQQSLMHYGIATAATAHDEAMARDAARRAAEEQARIDAMSELESIGHTGYVPVAATGDQVLAAARLVGADLGIEIVTPPEWSSERSDDPVRAIARASAVRVRAVTLTDRWWRLGVESMMGFRTDLGEPVALLARKGGGFDLVDPTTGVRQRVNPAVAQGLRPTAYVFYTPLPSEGVGIRDLLTFGLRGSRGDMRRMIFFSLVSGLLSLVIPIATGSILGNLVPQGETSLVVAAALVLFLVVFASTGVLLARSANLLRVQGRLLAGMQTGLWDRLISLPVEFFSRYTVADLSLRVAGAEMIQQIFASVASTTLLAAVTLVFSIGLLFVYNTGLAALVLAVTLVVVFISATITWQQIKRLRAMYDARGEASAVLLQLVQGIDKVRASAAENRALDAWSSKFAAQARLLLSSQKLSAIRTAIYAALPVLLTLTVFAVVGANPSMMTTAAFLSFIAALGQISSATTQLDLSLGYILNIVPIFDRMRPVLTEPAELARGATDPGPLQGQVALNNVTFRYPGMSATVLTDVDLRVAPGEFVGLVGPSGSGKSTIVRLLLGFEEPESGSITFDAKDLATLDVRAVRSQIGVALQNAAVTGADILSAIKGDWPLTEDQAWQAAEKVGLADEIRALPMGMRTLLGDNAVTFSGGQRQRLVLAAAIARNPRVVILDEATSALDSVTQATVADSFARLQVTRIVVAHRLSTIRQADRIVVLDGGRVVQQGSYAELAASPGLFASMVNRQTL